MKIEEGELDESVVTLDSYNSDLNLVIDASLYSGQPLTSEGFAFMWAGARATHGASKGKFCFEVKVLQHLDVSHLPSDEPNPHVIRVGFSVESSSMQLGEDPLSYGYGGTGKISTNCIFKDFGSPFMEGDCVLAVVNMDSDPIQIGFGKNGNFIGWAYKINKSELQGKALFPHVLTKNCSFEVNFGQKEKPYFPLPDAVKDFTFIGCLPLEQRESGTRSPKRKEDCEILMMCGLPGAGKSVWAAEYFNKHPEKKYNVLGTNNIIDKMKVMGLPRKRNYAGRWDVLIQMATKCLNKMFEIGSKLKRNYILDQTNVYSTAQRRKMRNFEGFKRIAVVVVPTEQEYKRRCDKRDREEGKDIPDSAVLEMKANFKLPEVNDIFDDVIFTEVSRDEAEKLVANYNEEGRAAVGPPRKQFRPNEQSPAFGGGRGFDTGRGNFISNRSSSFGSGRGGYAGRGGFDSDRGGYEGARGGRGGFGGNRGGFDGKRGGYGAGGRGLYDSSRGNFDKKRSSFEGGRGGFDGGHGSYEGARGGFDGGRVGFEGNRGFEGRGGFEGSRLGGRGKFDGSRSSYDGGRGGYDGNRGGFDGNRGGYNSGRGGYDSGRGGYDGGRVGFESSKGGYDRKTFDEPASRFDRVQARPGNGNRNFGGNSPSGFSGSASQVNYGYGSSTNFNETSGGFGNNSSSFSSRGGSRGNHSRGNFGVGRGAGSQTSFGGRDYNFGNESLTIKLFSDSSVGKEPALGAYDKGSANSSQRGNRGFRGGASRGGSSRGSNIARGGITSSRGYSIGGPPSTRGEYNRETSGNYTGVYGDYNEKLQSGYRDSTETYTRRESSYPPAFPGSFKKEPGQSSGGYDGGSNRSRGGRGRTSTRWSAETSHSYSQRSSSNIQISTSYSDFGATVKAEPASNTTSQRYDSFPTQASNYGSYGQSNQTTQGFQGTQQPFGYQQSAVNAGSQSWTGAQTAAGNNLVGQGTSDQSQWSQLYQQSQPNQHLNQFYGQPAAAATATAYGSVYAAK